VIPEKGIFDELETLGCQRIGRSLVDLCPCGSGRKFTHCHGTAKPPRAAAPTAMASAQE
jgi:uncharacterized protein YchJ